MKVNCYVKGHQGGSRCPDCLNSTASNPYPIGGTARYAAERVRDMFADHDVEVGESLIAQIEGIVSAMIRERDDETINRAYQIVHDYIDSDEFYDILPGDGQEAGSRPPAPAPSGEPPTDREAAELVCERLNGFSDEPILGKIFPVFLELAKELIEAKRDLDCERGVLTMTVARLGGTVEGNPTARHNFLQRIDELTRIESDLKRMLGEALGNVKTMQYTLQEIYEYCKDYADAPTLTKQTALGVVRGAQEKAWRELQGKTVIPESSPVDLQEEARKWLIAYWKLTPEQATGSSYQGILPETAKMLAAFADHMREGK